MKFQVTQKGVNVTDKEGKQVAVAKGEVIDVDGDKVPAWLVGKGRPVEGKAAVTNPAKEPVKEPAKEPSKQPENQDDQKSADNTPAKK